MRVEEEKKKKQKQKSDEKFPTVHSGNGLVLSKIKKKEETKTKQWREICIRLAE